MKYIIKITLTVAFISFLASNNVSAQDIKEVKSTQVELKYKVEEVKMNALSNLQPTVNATSKLKKQRVNAIKVYGLVDRNGNKLPSKESVNQIPE